MSDLINVSFKDTSNYVTYDSDDVVGCPIDHIWGPCNVLQVMTQQDFLNNYPESLPVGAGLNYVAPYAYPYAAAKRAFDTGASKVETIRLQGTNTYAQFVIAAAADNTLTPKRNAVKDSDANVLNVTLRYPGCIPYSLFPYADAKVKVVIITDKTQVGYEAPIVIDLIGVSSTGDEVTIEHMIGGFTPNEIVDGKSFFIQDVLADQSNFLDCYVKATSFTAFSDDALLSAIPYVHTATSADEFAAVYTNYYADSEKSNATILIPCLSDVKVYSAAGVAASTRMTCNAIQGYPLSGDFTKTAIKAYWATLSKDKFSSFLAGREVVSCLNTVLLMDCTAAQAGRMCSVAKSVNLNQLPSAKTYGAFPGTLIKSLSFSEVLELHALGINSVYSASYGPTIFGIKTLHPRQTSYYGKLNIMRVLAAVLAPIMSSALDVIHTDVSSNSISRANYETQLNSVLSNFIGQSCLKAQSNASCSDELNSDAATNGGEKLIIELTLWFIKLTESVSINVIATDSSVTASLS